MKYYAIFFFLVTLSGCKSDECCSSADDCPPQAQLFSFRIFDKETGEDLLPINGEFNEDLVDIYTIRYDGIRRYLNPIPIKSPDGYVFLNFELGANVDVYFRYEDRTDTLKSREVWRKHPCGEFFMKHIYYNDSLLCEFCDESVYILYK